MGFNLYDSKGCAIEKQRFTWREVTQYILLLDPRESWLAQWLLHETNEVYHYYGCVQHETNALLQGIWQRFFDYELGHFHLVNELFKQYKQRDPVQFCQLYCRNR